MKYEDADDLYRHLISAKEWAERRHINEYQMFRDFNNSWVDERARIGKGTLIFPGCIIMGKTRIGKKCVIGPMACLEDVTLGNGSHIGFTAQLKRVKAGKRLAANHHCYIGDAIIGDGVNIGAGVITANYDGTKKQATRIGDGAFIGTNVNLIAPITIGREAMVAAGTTIDGRKLEGGTIPAYSFVIARPELHIGESVFARKTERGYEIIRIPEEQRTLLKAVFNATEIDLRKYPALIRDWLTTPHKTLDNRMPLDLIVEGKGNLVDAVLTEMLGGTFSL